MMPTLFNNVKRMERHETMTMDLCRKPCSSMKGREMSCTIILNLVQQYVLDVWYLGDRFPQ